MKASNVIKFRPRTEEATDTTSSGGGGGDVIEIKLDFGDWEPQPIEPLEEPSSGHSITAFVIGLLLGGAL